MDKDCCVDVAGVCVDGVFKVGGVSVGVGG